MATDLDKRLDAIEAAALAVYARHGLPTRPGHYRRGPRALRWTFIGADIAPEDRWAMVLERPPERGWRHGALEALGLHEPHPALNAAARALEACRVLRGQLASGEAVSAEHVEALLALSDAMKPPRARSRSSA